MIFTSLITLVLTIAIVFLVKLVTDRRKYSHIPSPPYHPILEFISGHASHLQRVRKTSPNCLYTDYIRSVFHDLKTKTFVLHRYMNSEIYTIDLNKCSVILSNIDKFKKSEMEANFLAKFCGARFLGGYNLLTSAGDEIWAKKRKIMDASFHRKSLKMTYDGMKMAADRMIESVARVGNPEKVANIYEILFLGALEVICRTGFSIEEDDLPGSETIERMNDIFRGIGAAYEMDMAYFLPWCEREVKQRIYQNILLVREFLRKRLMKRVKNEEEMKEKNDILAHIIRANMSVEGFGVEEILDDFFSFFIAGMETTSNSMSFFLLMMVKHPEVCDRVRSEVDEVFGGRDEVEYEELWKLGYLEQCIKETMRLYSVAEETNRRSLTSTEVDGLFLPKGAELYISQSIIHREQEYWGEDADKFNPDNFGPGRTILPFSYMPFMAGPRACIGKHFAMMEMKIMLSKFLHAFEFGNPEIAHDKESRLVCKSDITQKPKNGVPLLIRRR